MSDIPEPLKAFTFHGMDLKVGPTQSTGECPFCGKNKFYVSNTSTKWDCKACGMAGNSLEFIRKLWEKSLPASKCDDVEEFKKDRKLLSVEILDLWGVRKSLLNGQWIVPGFALFGRKLQQLYRYATIKGGKRALFATPGFKHGIFGMCNWNNKAKEVHALEGPWDGMAYHETMLSFRKSDTGISPTSNKAVSLANDINIVAFPGANVFSDEWSNIGESRKLVLFYDNDHARKENGSTIMGAGRAGCKKTVEKLWKADSPPNEIHYLQWKEPEGFDASLPNGYDVRDILTKKEHTSVFQRKDTLKLLQSKIKPIPQEWIKGRTTAAAKAGKVEILPLACNEWTILRESWRKAMKWPDPGEGLDYALTVMLASVISTESAGDQLWVKIIGPAACGKSTLCEALAIAKKYTSSKSTITGFHSGFKTDSKGQVDNSIVSGLFNKTLITKDGDTLLQAPNINQILSEARDIYDRVSRAQYRNGVSREYDQINMTWILCGTSSLRTLDSSELGERFLSCIIMDGIDDDFEYQIAMRAAQQAKIDIGTQAGPKTENPAKMMARQLTGGYVEYLRENSIELLSSINLPDEYLDRCVRYAKFVAILRARPSLKQNESVEREFSTRLTTQIVRLATAVAAIYNYKEVNEEVMHIVKKVAIDTSKGSTLGIVKYLFEHGEKGASWQAIQMNCHSEDETLKGLIKFLIRIKVVESYEPEIISFRNRTTKGPKRYRLPQKIYELYKFVMGGKEVKLTNQ